MSDLHVSEVSTRRRSTTGLVHEMADFGVKTLCSRDLAEPWEWTDDPVSCGHCRRLVALRDREETE